jgi:hypothetical protein
MNIIQHSPCQVLHRAFQGQTGKPTGKTCRNTPYTGSYQAKYADAHSFHFLCLCLGTSSLSNAAESDSVLDTAERFIRLQTQGMPGQVKLTMGKLDVSRLPPCSALEAFSPPGARMRAEVTSAFAVWGQTSGAFMYL